MKRNGMKLIAILLALVMVLALAACGGGGAAPTPTQAPSGGGTTPSGGGTTPSGGGATAEKKVLNVAIASDEGTLSPCVMTTAALGIAYVVLEPLWDVTIDGTVIMELCESVDVVSDTEQTIHLRQGVKFSNGNPLTASDVLFSMKLHKAAGAIGGARVQTVDLEKTNVIDDNTLDLHLLAPTIANWTILSQCRIYDEESYTEEGAALHPIGTGAFIVTDYVPGSSITLEKNENYWGAEPAFDVMNVKVLAEDSQRVNALETNLVDLAAITTTDYDYVNGLDGIGILGNYTGNYCGMNFNFSPSAAFYQNEDARRAICHAINGEAILNTVYLGHGKMMHACVPDYCFDFEDRFNDLDDTYSIGYNVDLARQLAESSGLSQKTVRIVTNGTTTAIRMAEMAQAMLKDANIPAEIFNYDPATATQMQYSLDGAWDIMIGGGIAPNRRVGDLLINGVRYRPDLTAEGAFEDNAAYLEEVPLCMSLQDEKALSDELYKMMGIYEKQVLGYSLFDMENYMGYDEALDPASIRLSVGSSYPRYHEIKFA